MDPKCRNCGLYIETRPTWRIDRWYCGPKCVAQYARRQGRFTNKPIHDELELTMTGDCVVCGKQFGFNAYANRAGLREPLYCSAACRQKAYRERKKEELARGKGK